MSKKISIGIIIAVVALILINVWFTQKQPTKYTGPVEKITVAGFVGEASTLVYVAEAMDFLKKMD